MVGEARQSLARLVGQFPEAELLIDLSAKSLTFANESFEFDMQESSREAFLLGRFDPLDELLVAKDRISGVANRLGGGSHQ